jgi:hypothetical protein
VYFPNLFFPITNTSPDWTLIYCKYKYTAKFKILEDGAERSFGAEYMNNFIF